MPDTSNPQDQIPSLLYLLCGVAADAPAGSRTQYAALHAAVAAVEAKNTAWAEEPRFEDTAALERCRCEILTVVRRLPESRGHRDALSVIEDAINKIAFWNDSPSARRNRASDGSGATITAAPSGGA